MKKNHFMKSVIGIVVTLCLMGVGTGSANAAVVTEIPQDEIVQVGNDFVAGFKEFLREEGVDDVRSLPMAEREQLLDQYLDVQSNTRGVLETVSIIVGLIVAAISIGQSAYNAGRYAAMQANSRGILTKQQYRAAPDSLYWGIVGGAAAAVGPVFGTLAANGFNDWMWDR